MRNELEIKVKTQRRDVRALEEVDMNSENFWNILTEENKEKVEELLKYYNGSDGYKGRIFELYEEGANAIGLTLDEYLKEITPNEYVEEMYFQKL